MRVLLLTWQIKKRNRPLCMIFFACLALLFLFPVLIRSEAFVLRVLEFTFLFAALGIAWNILAYDGRISLGHAAFFGIGAYASSLLSVSFAIDPLESIWLGGVFAAFFGFILSGLFNKLRGAYFALATLAAVELPKVVVENWEHITRGSMGILGIPPLSVSFSTLHQRLFSYYFDLLFLLVVSIFTVLLFSSRWGWALTAIRQDERAAKAIGVNVWCHRLTVFTLSAFISGVCGAIYAHSIGVIEPNMVFGIYYSAIPMIMSIFGGRFSALGPIVGTFVLFPLDQLLLQPLFPSGHQILFGTVIMVTILVMPRGIMGRK